MASLKRLLAAVAAAGGALLYLWLAGVRYAGLARRRRAAKAAARRERFRSG